MIATHHEHVDVVMIARDAAEMQINRPSAVKVEGRAQIPDRLRNLK
jgi:hypothetical protein